MLHALLFVLIGLALIVVYLSAKSRAKRAVKDLELSVDAARHADENGDRSHSERNWRGARDLLRGAQRALDKHDWDKAEELCELGFTLLELPPREVSQSSQVRRQPRVSATAAPRRWQKPRTTPACTTGHP